MKKPEVSVIIRTYNEEKKIGECLKAVFNQKIKYPLEVIIVDSESTDNTLKIASKFPVKIIKIKKKDFTYGKNFAYGKALNIGCEAAKGKFLVLLSAHAIPTNTNWLATLLKNFKNKKVAGVYGKEIPAKDCNPLEKRRILAHLKKSENKKTIQPKNYVFSNVNSIILKKIWEKIKFDEKLPISEDRGWSKKVQVRNYLIVYDPEAVVYHSHNYNFKQIYCRYYKTIYANLLILNKKFFLRPILDIPYNFYRDIEYILKNKCSLIWVFKSFIIGFLLIAAVLSASFDRILK